MVVLGVALIAGAITAPAARADFIQTFTTPAGATTGGQPVDASATFDITAGQIGITLTNLQANPTSVVQNLSDLSFMVVSGSLDGSTLKSSSGNEITVNKDSTTSPGGTGVSTGWAYTGAGSQGLLDVLGTTIGPAHLIIGPPGPGGVYSNANGSIAGNGPHNPFLDQTASFTITGTGITADSRITGVVFSFGTTEGANHVPAVPEPSTLAIAGLGGLGLLGVCLRRRRSQ
jgi:hypothetical protein